MKRFHVHVAVDDLDQSLRFYSALFGSQPAVTKPDYAKWMLDDPRINFAISHRGSKHGVNHLGLQVDSAEELDALQAQHESARLAVFAEGETQCCYAHSRKHWLTDPQGVAWEVYHSMGQVQTYHGAEPEAAAPAGACCNPAQTDSDAPSAASTRDHPVTKTQTVAGCSTACCAAPAAA